MHKQLDHDAEIQLGHETLDDIQEAKKFLSVWLGVLLAAVFLAWARGFKVERFIEDFIAVTFIVFATSKFVQLESFLQTYHTFDVLAKRFLVWGYAVPFIEGVLGVAFLLLDQSNLLNLLTLLFTTMAVFGAGRELRNRSNLMTPWLGDVVRLPLSKVVFIQNLAIGFLVLFLIII